MDDALIIAALLNGEGPNAIRTDGTGSPLGAPGGGCEDCEGGRGWQTTYLLGTGLKFAAAGSGVIAAGRQGAGGGGGLLPTFGNLGDDAAGTVAGTLSRGGGGYRIGGQLAEGSYDFVVQNGQVIVGKGHAALAGGGRVTYAGEVTLRGGEIVMWTKRLGPLQAGCCLCG